MPAEFRAKDFVPACGTHMLVQANGLCLMGNFKLMKRPKMTLHFMLVGRFNTEEPCTYLV